MKNSIVKTKENKKEKILNIQIIFKINQMIKMTTKYKVFQDSQRMMVKKLLLIKKYKNSNPFNKLGKELVKICYKNSIKRKIIMITSF